MEYLTVRELAEKWNLSERRIRLMCSEGKIKGVIRKGRSYRIPSDAIRPVDGRAVRGKKIPQQYQELFAEIDSMKKELHRYRITGLGQKKTVRDRFLEEFIYHSNSLSGNTMSLSDTRMILAGKTMAQKPLKDLLEIIGHKEAFEYVEKMAEERAKLSEKLICEIHARILVDKWEERGRYRESSISLPAAMNESAEAKEIPLLMEELIKKHAERKKKMHAIEANAVFHIEFQEIHPFIDGNSRTNRMILNFFLIEDGYFPICIKKEEKEIYQEAFQKYHENGDASSMVFLIAEHLREEIGGYLNLQK